MKKLLMIIPVFLFAFALTASADECNPCPGPEPVMRCCPSVNVSNLNASLVKGNIGMSTNTGGNNANWNAGLGKIYTGNAIAGANLTQQVGYNETRVTAPWMTRINVKNANLAAVSGNIGMSTNTGENNANGNKGMCKKGGQCMPKVMVKAGAGVIETGNAKAGSNMMQLVGSNFTKIGSAN